MKPRVGVLFSPRGAASARDVLVAAAGDIEIVPLLRSGAGQRQPALPLLINRLFGAPLEIDEERLTDPGPPLAGVVTFADAELELAAALGAHLGVRHRDATPADKYRQRTVVGGAGFSRIAALPVDSAQDLAEAARLLGYPFVVKPRRGAGGTDVTIVRDPAQAAALTESWRWTSGTLYAEQFIPTADRPPGAWRADYVSVEVQSIGGSHDVITVFDKFPVHERSSQTRQGGRMATTGDILPSGLPLRLRAEVEELVLGAHRALAMDDGITHTEVKLGADGPEIIEINCRVGGHLSRVLNRRSGFDLVRQALLITAGLPPQPLPDNTGERHVAGLFVPFADTDGPVRSQVSPRALRTPGVAAVDEVARAGAARTDTDAIACNVVLDCPQEDDLRHATAGFLARVGELFAEDGVGHRDWTAEMSARLDAGPSAAPAPRPTPSPGRSL
ncbi:acetyl-CoA carboxylase biotin carboxylase subunit family protein [Kitasatospora sp. NPDC127059]|uniref:ATP-grasp domain-containing protein n=1 Tax=unclassified Kitasatospora TaxID=2633591 RepID=UPI0036688424